MSNNRNQKPLIVLIQGSLAKDSKTSIVIDAVNNKLVEKNISTRIIDLCALDLEFCDGRPLSEYNDDMKTSYEILEKADENHHQKHDKKIITPKIFEKIDAMTSRLIEMIELIRKK